MDALGIARLTEAQRVALRYFMERKTAKQIAIELGITPKAVELRLKGARDALGVSSSAEAARILAAAENITFRETLGGSTEVADSSISLSPSDIGGESGGTGKARDRKVMSEARAAFTHRPARLQQGLGWPLRLEGDRHNELGLSARLLWPFLATFGIGVAMGTLVIGGSLLSLASVAVLHLFN